MPGFWKKGKWALLLVAVIAVLFVARISGLERERLSPVEIWFRDLLAPLQSGASAVLSGTKTAGEYTESRSRLIQDKKNLTAEIVQLNKEIDALHEKELENVRLRRLLGMQESIKGEWGSVAARVIARDPGNWYHTVTLDKGSEDGLAKGMAVINGDGLVGQVLSVTKKTAEVLLILDKDGAVSCLAQLSRTPGVAEGVDSPKGFLQMIHTPEDTNLKENQVIVTSGLGGIFPAGLRIGYIVKVESEANGLMKQALIKPFVDFDRLEEVLVLTQGGGRQ